MDVILSDGHHESGHVRFLLLLSVTKRFDKVSVFHKIKIFNNTNGC